MATRSQPHGTWWLKFGSIQVITQVLESPVIYLWFNLTNMP